MNQTHKLHAPSDPELFLFITREDNWNTAKIYFKGSLIYEAQTINPLLEGITLTIDGLGVVKAKLDSTKKNLEIDVDGKPFIEDEASKKKIDVSGLVYIFYLISTLNFIGSLLYGVFSTPESDPDLIILTVSLFLFFAILYGITGFLISKRVYWFYFVGGGVFALITLIELLSLVEVSIAGKEIVRLIIRLVFLMFIIMKAKDILGAMRQSKAVQKNELDQ